MADISIGDVAQLTAVGLCASQTVLNTWFYRCVSLGSSLGTSVTTAMEELITKIEGTVGGLGDKFIALMPTNYTLVRHTAQVVSPVRYTKVFGAVVNTAGDSGAICSTANIAAVITRRGDLATRKDVGSLHLVYPDALTEATTGIINAGYLSAMDDLCLQMKATLTLAPSTLVWEPILFHRTGTPNYSKVTYCFAQNTIRVMRRRTVGLGI